jgi:hypothetical protein
MNKKLFCFYPLVIFLDACFQKIKVSFRYKLKKSNQRAKQDVWLSHPKNLIIIFCLIPLYNYGKIITSLRWISLERFDSSLQKQYRCIADIFLHKFQLIFSILQCKIKEFRRSFSSTMKVFLLYVFIWKKKLILNLNYKLTRIIILIIIINIIKYYL